MSDVARHADAAARATRLYPRGALRSAYVAGAGAAIAGSPVSACPYRGNGGWQPAWRNAWRRGWESVGEDDWG